MATQSARRAATRDAILAAAEELFRSRGFEGAAVEQITAAANVAKGTFYQHFTTKAEVALALIRRRQAAALCEVEARLAQGQPPLAVGRWLVGLLAASCEEHRKSVVPMLALEIARPARKGRPSTRAMFARVVSEAQRWHDIRIDMPARSLALLLSGALVVVVIEWAHLRKPGPLLPRLEKAWKVFVEGAKA